MDDKILSMIPGAGGMPTATPPAEEQAVPAKPKRKTTKKRIGKPEIEKARAKLDSFKAEKGTLNTTIRRNEEWYRTRHMELIRTGVRGDPALEGVTTRREGEEVEPVSAWLFSAIQNFHADYMDNFPRANVLPRERGDEPEAYKLTRILPCLLDRIGFEEVYSRAGWTKAIQGWSAYTVVWDKDADGGAGEIAIRRARLLNLYWDMSVDNIQDSSDVFYLHERDREDLIAEFPKIERELAVSDSDYERHDGSKPSGFATKVTVVDWYYKRRVRGRTVLHYAQFVGDVLLYASENDGEYCERGWYDHGLYPFVIDVLYPMEDQVYGFGKIAVGASKQAYIDILSQTIMRNALWGGEPRYFAKTGHGINMEDFCNLKKKIVEVSSMPDEQHLRRIEVAPLDGGAMALKNSMVEELRETTNMRDVATGSPTGGVTSASGIAALQEAAGKTSRDSNRTSFRAFRGVVMLIIELIRQFYTDDHFFRILNEDTGEMEYIGVSNRRMISGERENPVTGEPERYERHALFDLEITTEKSSHYTRMAQNELMLSFYNGGFFDPQRATQAMACLQLMDFEGKEEMNRMLAENDNREELLRAALEVYVAQAQAYDELAASVGAPTGATEQAQALVAQVTGGQGMGGGGMASLPSLSGESSYTKNARKEAAAAASPT